LILSMAATPISTLDQSRTRCCLYAQAMVAQSAHALTLNF
jgi:hypothetical protein